MKLNKKNEVEAVEDESCECVICHATFVGFGNNPDPVAPFNSGRCCDACNSTYVIPTRAGWIPSRTDGNSTDLKDVTDLS